jgi:hypothetical protein
MIDRRLLKVLSDDRTNPVALPLWPFYRIVVSCPGLPARGPKHANGLLSFPSILSPMLLAALALIAALKTGISASQGRCYVTGFYINTYYADIITRSSRVCAAASRLTIAAVWVLRFLLNRPPWALNSKPWN